MIIPIISIFIEEARKPMRFYEMEKDVTNDELG
jgi:hypothetical protein